MRTQQEEIEIIKAALDAEPGYRGVANEGLLLEACQGQPATARTVLAAFQRIKHKLAINADYADAYAELWQEYPEYRLDCNIKILDSLASVHQTITYDILRKLVENPNVRQQLVLTSRAVQAIRDEQERLGLIEKILGTHTDPNGNEVANDKYEWRGNVDGRLYSGTRAELEQDDLPRLQYINDYVQAQRALYAADTKTVREAARKREIHEAQIRAGMKAKLVFAPITEAYEPPNRPGVRIPWSENMLRRLQNSEISRLFELFGEEQLNSACRKTAAQQLQ
jgi:hypothetical protein